MAKAVGQFTIIDLNDITISSTAPAVKVVDMIWLDTSTVPNQLKKWSGTTWVNVGDRNADIEIGGRNYFNNKTFDSNNERVLNDYQGVGSFTQFYNLTVPMGEFLGKDCILSFDCISPNGSTSLSVYNNNGNPRYLANFSNITSPINSSWTKQKIKMTITDRGSSYSEPTSNKIEIYAPNKMGVKIRNVKLEIGNKATDWTPAPEDVDQKFTNYYTKTETNTQINAAKDSIDLSVDTKISTATTTINNRTDQVLTSYSTTTEMNSAINLKGAEIDASVSQKIIGTYYQEATPTNPKAKEIWYKVENQQFIIGATNSFTIGNALGHTIGQNNPSKKAYRYNGTSWDSITDSDIDNVKYDVAGINISLDGIKQRVESSDGRIGSLEVTANSITSRVSDAEGNIGSLQVTASSIISRIDNINGSGSSIEQFSNSITSRVTDAEGNISTIKQTSDKIALAVNNSKLEFDSNGLTIKNGGFKILNGTQQVFYIDQYGKLIMISEFYNTTGSYGVRIANGKIEVSSGNSAPGPANWGSVCGNIYGIYQDFFPNGYTSQLILEGVTGARLRSTNGSAYFAIAGSNAYINGTVNINGDVYTKKKHSNVLSTDYVLVSTT